MSEFLIFAINIIRKLETPSDGLLSLVKFNFLND